MIDPSTPPVIVVGAGPVGMTAAAVLAQAGIPTAVVESAPEPQPDWRASTFHAATLELLKDIGITEQMHAEGLVVPRYQFRDRREGLVAEFDLGLLRDETPFPYRLQLNQQRLVRFLHDRLLADPLVRLRFGTRLIDLSTDADGVEATVETPEGTERLRGAYVIGADGARSTVRRQLGIPFEGFTYPERFLIVSTPVDMSAQVPGIAEVNYISDPEQWLFILRTPEAWRVLWPVPSGVGDEEATAPEGMQRQLQSVAPLAGGYPIIDHQIYHVHQRVAATFRSGRALLIGDAAHVNSPVGGVGLNSGIHDAMDLTRRLVRILTEGADADAELDGFARCRRRIALEYVQADTQRNTDRLRETDEETRLTNQRELRALAADPDRARAWLRRVSLLESVQRFGIGTPHTELEGTPA
ncbi:pentachlorophenol monooxygenase [Streptomyces sulfonofaciens]|uniref:Pentachlorophenol monooxygenase n=1 Tax=Streptomyces sulfonofaciens TaxID=68272 RepID=A0A919GL42_9ACTN|nr:NAD(P)/FAD-dependent oxidoreductase [Streptomyces sulfonofaciens]GHH86219.1 pentachlorophenol monooxygenase [Streptomyces sulfonofaciens]